MPAQVPQQQHTGEQVRRLSIENRAALRTALATVTTLYIAFFFHMNKPYWGGMAVVLVANVYTGNILDKALMRVTGTVIGAWIGFFLVGFIGDSMLLYFLLNFLIVSVAVYYYNFSRFAYAWLLGAIAAFIVISDVAITPAEAVWEAYWRPFEIALAVLVSAVFAFCVFPNRIADKVTHDVHEIFASIDKLFDSLSKVLTENDRALIPLISADNIQLKTTVRQALEGVVLMRHELEYNQNQLDKYRFLLDACLSFCRALNYFLSLNTLCSKATHLPVKEVIAAMRNDFAALHADFFSESTPRPLQTESALTAFDKTFTHKTDLTTDAYKYVLNMRHFFQQMIGLLSRLQVVLRGEENQLPVKPVISTQQQLRTDPNAMIHGIKSGLTAILALGIWLFINIPGGLNGIISSIVISARRNLFDLQNIGAWRLLGCVLGGGIGLYSLQSFTMNLYLLLTIIFFTVWAFSFFSFTQIKYAYVGMQANIAVILALAQQGGEAVSIIPALERLSGIIIGIVASLIIANLIWRMSVLSMLQQQLRTLRMKLMHNVACLLSNEEREPEFFDLIDAFWNCRGLLDQLSEKYAVTNPNTVQMTSKQTQIVAAKKEERALNAIQVTLNNMRESIDQKRARQTASDCGIDLSALEDKLRILYSSPITDYDAHALHQSIEQSVAALMMYHNKAELNYMDLENCAAYLYALSKINEARQACA